MKTRERFTNRRRARMRTGWTTQIKGYHHARGREPLRTWIQFPPQVCSLLGLRSGLRFKVIASAGRLVLKPKQVASAIHPMFRKMQGAERVRFERRWARWSRSGRARLSRRSSRSGRLP